MVHLPWLILMVNVGKYTYMDGKGTVDSIKNRMGPYQWIPKEMTRTTRYAQV